MLLNVVQTSEMDETLEPLSGIFCGDNFCNNSCLQRNKMTVMHNRYPSETKKKSRWAH